MAMKVKLDKKEPKAKSVLTLADLRAPGESKAKNSAYLITGLAWIGLVLIGLALPLRPYSAYAGLAWIVLSALYFGGMAGSSQRKLVAAQWQQMLRARLTAPAEIEQMVRTQSRTLGLAIPDLLLAEGLPEVTIIGKTLRLTQTLRSTVSDEELAGLIGHELGHLKAGHLGLLGLISRMQQLDPLLRYTLGLPMTILASTLRNWVPLAEQTADRVALLLTQNQKAYGSAIMKLAIAGSGGQVQYRETDGWRDVEATAEEVSTAELGQYLSRKGDLALEGGELTAHFRLGEFIRQHPEVQERINELTRYADSPEFRATLEKMKGSTATASRP